MNEFPIGTEIVVPAQEGRYQLAFTVKEKTPEGTIIQTATGVKRKIPALSQYVDDLNGVVHLPPSGIPIIDAVLSGKAKYLGKGDDGLVFRVKDQVVKVGTVVPFDPYAIAQRSPKMALENIHRIHNVSEEMREAGVPGILPSTFISYGGRGFQIKPYVEIPEKLTFDQLEAVRRALEAMHKTGFAMNDSIQVGLWHGEPYFFDTSKAGYSSGDNFKFDTSSLAFLYRQSGFKLPREVSLTDEYLDLTAPLAISEKIEKSGGKKAYIRKLDDVFARMRKSLEAGEEHFWVDLDTIDEEYEEAIAMVESVGREENSSRSGLNESLLLKEAHTAVRGEVLESAKRAVRSGAHSPTLRYYNAGAEAILFRDGIGNLFKVARGGRDLGWEALATALVSRYGLAPELFHYDEPNGVIVKRHVEGDVGYFGDRNESKRRETYERIEEILASQELTRPEFKEDSFVHSDNGLTMMVDLGFVQPTGQRLAHHLLSLDIKKIPSQNHFFIQHDIVTAFNDGTLTDQQALHLLSSLEPAWRKQGEEIIQSQNVIRQKNPSIATENLEYLVEAVSSYEGAELFQEHYPQSYEEPERLLEENPEPWSKYYRGRNFLWIGTPGRMLRMEREQLEPIEGNIFYPEKLTAVASVGRWAKSPVPMFAGYGQPWMMDEGRYEEALEYDEYEPNYHSDPSDIGEAFMQVRDGNHRTFGALLSGEPYVYVMVDNNTMQEYKEWVRDGRSEENRSLPLLEYLDEHLE